MTISPINNYINTPLIITSANIPTEDVARENAVRDKVSGPVKTAKTAKEKKIKKGDKNFQDTSWDPSRHPSYHHEKPVETSLNELMGVHDHIDVNESDFVLLQRLISTSSYIEKNELSYSISYEFPINIDREIKHLTDIARKNAAIKHHYDFAITPNVHSDLSIIL